MKHIIKLFCLMLSVNTVAFAEQADLNRIVRDLDRALFDQGFNRCELGQFERLLSESFEFIHDKNGPANKSGFIAGMKSGLCGDPEKYQSVRRLVAPTHKVYPLLKQGEVYGAVQQGEHEFFEKTNAGNELRVGYARFTNVWLIESGEWRLAKSISFDHQGAQEPGADKVNFLDRSDVEDWIRNLGVPTLGVGIISDGRLQKLEVHGALSDGEAAPYNAIFNVASLTKPVVAILTLKLVSQDRWDLDAPLHNYWIDPEVADDPRHKLLTTRHVLSHQTGFPNWRRSLPSGRLGFDFDPGTAYQYSGEGFEYLRNALEAHFEKPLEQLANELVFEPVGMADSSLIWSDHVDSQRYVPNYDRNGDRYQTVQRESANAADDLLTTIGDYGRFLKSVMNGVGLSDAVFKEMSSKQIQTKAGKHFALGFERYDLGGDEYALSHGGADNGVQTIAFILPDTGKGLLIFTNVDDGYKVYKELISYYLGAAGDKIFEIETAK